MNNLNNAENWRDIDGYDNYMISNLGNIKNTKTKKILKHLIKPNGYHAIDLSKDNKTVRYYIHRLVADAFINNPDNKPNVDHINNDKNDNTIFNLRWVTHSQNMMNRKKKNTNNKYKGVIYDKNYKKYKVQINKDKKIMYLKYFDDEKEAAEKYNKYANKFFGKFAKLNDISDEDSDDE